MDTIKIAQFIRKNYILILLILILAVGAAARIYKLDFYLRFYKDEPDHLIIIKDIDKGELPLHGPRALDLNYYQIYLGPAYYYIMYLPYKITNFHPIGGAVFIVLANILALWLFFKLTKELFNDRIALFSVFLASVSNFLILYSRWSWNPNLLLLFLMIVLFSLYKVINNKINWIWLLTVSTAIIVQIHYSGFLLIPVIIILLLIYKPKIKVSTIFLNIAIFVFSFFPQVLYELKNNYIGLESFRYFFFHQPTIINHTFQESAHKVIEQYIEIFKALFLNEKKYNLANLLLLIIFFGYFLYCSITSFIKKGLFKSQNYLFVIIWFLVFLSIASLYFMRLESIFNYYLMIVFPVLYIAAGIFLYNLWKMKIIGKILVTIFLILFFAVNYQCFFNNFSDIDKARTSGEEFKRFEYLTFHDMDDISKYIVNDANGQKFLVKYYSSYIPGFSFQQGYNYLLQLYAGTNPIDENSNLIYAIIQPYKLSHEDLAQFGKIISVNRFGNIDVVKIIKLP